jgi:hypothetical protein
MANSLNSIGLMLVAAVFSVVLAAGSSAFAAATPPSLTVPDKGITPQHKDQIAARIRYWLDGIREAKDETALANARKGFASDYSLHESAEYRFAFAGVAAKECVELLKLDDNAKLVTVAMMIASLPQASIQPALDAMVVHRNPAVRYFGWEGYRGAKAAIIAQSADSTDKMLKQMGDRLAVEESPLVVGQIYSAMIFGASETGGMSGDAVAKAERQFAAVLAKTWMRQCEQVLVGGVDVAAAAGRGVALLQQEGEAVAADKAALKPVLQMLADVAYAAATAYDKALTAKDNAIADADAQLLKDCEAALNAVLKTTNNYLEKPLTEPKIQDRGQAVKSYVDKGSGKNYGVLKWIDDLKALGVVEPKIEAPKAPATKPAAAVTKPTTTATSPTTKP